MSEEKKEKHTMAIVFGMCFFCGMAGSIPSAIVSYNFYKLTAAENVSVKQRIVKAAQVDRVLALVEEKMYPRQEADELKKRVALLEALHAGDSPDHGG